MRERLQKILSRAGVASRRRAEELILTGQVSVNGRVVTELGTKADPERDHIKVGSRLIRMPAGELYFVLHKPTGCVSTMNDPEGRHSLRRYLRGVPTRVFPVGRLDFHASGLLLLTSDGELANRVLQAERLPQIYRVKVKGRPPAGLLAEVERQGGVQFRALGAPSALRLRRPAENVWLEVAFSAPRRDRWRQLLAQAGHPIEKMKRMGLGPLALGSLPVGRYRELSPAEVALLKRAVHLAHPRDSQPGPRIRRG